MVQPVATWIFTHCDVPSATYLRGVNLGLTQRIADETHYSALPLALKK